jgi:hypothetical protein
MVAIKTNNTNDFATYVVDMFVSLFLKLTTTTLASFCSVILLSLGPCNLVTRHGFMKTLTTLAVAIWLSTYVGKITDRLPLVTVRAMCQTVFDGSYPALL